jgi:heme oxygenase
MWREVRGLLASQLDTPDAVAHACDAAGHTFDALSHLLRSSFHERTAAA